MSVATETVAVQVLNVSNGVPVPVAIPVFAVSEIEIAYGMDGLIAVYNTDYTVTLVDETAFNTFSFTPTASLLTKINDLIAANPSEINAVYVRRKMPYTSSTSPANMTSTVFASKEIDRLWALTQQLQEQLSRTIIRAKSAVGATQLKLRALTAGKVPIVSASGDYIEDGPTAADIINAQTNAATATAAAAAALGYRNEAEQFRDEAEEATGVFTPFNTQVHNATAKATLADNDEFGIADSAASFGAKKHTWANLKAMILGYLNSTNDGTPLDADRVWTGDSSASFAPIYSTWTQIKAFLKTYFDGFYARLATDGNLTAGFTTTAVNDGTKSSGTYTPTPAGGNMKRIVNGGAFTLAAPSASNDYTMIIQITNNASAGAITLSGFSKTTGDTFTTTNGDDFFVYITKVNGFTHGQIQRLQ